MRIARWLTISIFLWIAEVVAVIITPAVVAFADRNTGRLPKWFWWMETPTAVLPGATGVVRPWVERYGWYVASVLWLWRNAVYALADSFRVDPEWSVAAFRTWGNPAVNNDPYVRGWFFGTISWPSGWAFEFRAVGPSLFGKCWAFRAGWKLSAWFEGRRFDDPGATGMLQAPSPRPFLSRK